MSNTPNQANQPKSSSPKTSFTPSHYELHISGRLGPQITVWFEDMTLAVNEEATPPQTIIRGYIIDQAALYGLISRIRDLGLTLLSVNQLDTEEIDRENLTERRADTSIEDD